MLADMLLEFHEPKQALAEFEVALKLSPNRFNGLYNAGVAAEQAGETLKAMQYYSTLLTMTDKGEQSTRPEFKHVNGFLASRRRRRSNGDHFAT
jgi:tetratricopeptide (TPR) repeat protein